MSNCAVSLKILRLLLTIAMGGRVVVEFFRIDPWGASFVKDYERLMREFGIQPLTSEIIKRLPSPHRLIRRGFVFGHRDLEVILRAVEGGENYAVITGIKPSGEYHLGAKITAEEFIYFLSLSPKARGFFAIADLEAYADNKVPLSKSKEIALSNLMDLLALGLDPKKVYVYRQSQEISVLRMAFLFSRAVTYNTLEAMYGDKPFGLYFSALVQAGDILLPQLPEHGGPKPTLVPVGADQDPHIRLTRDLARKYREEFGFILPSATYHKLIRDLAGREKMSKRNPMGNLYLTDSPELACKKIAAAYTGGRATAEDQRRLGGVPEVCTVFVELLSMHFVEDDRLLKEWYHECRTGSILCGECKARVCEIVSKWLMDHRRKRRKVADIALKLIEEGTLS